MTTATEPDLLSYLLHGPLVQMDDWIYELGELLKEQELRTGLPIFINEELLVNEP